MKKIVFVDYLPGFCPGLHLNKVQSLHITNLCTQWEHISRVTLLSHRAPTSRQRLRSTSRSFGKNPLENFIILKRNPYANFTILNKNPQQTLFICLHKHHHLEQNLKPFDYLQIADGGTLGLSAWWLGGNDMHQEGAWSWPRWKLGFIFMWLLNLCFQRSAFWLHQLDRRGAQWQQWLGRLHCNRQVFHKLFIRF